MTKTRTPYLSDEEIHLSDIDPATAELINDIQVTLTTAWFDVAPYLITSTYMTDGQIRITASSANYAIVSTVVRHNQDRTPTGTAERAIIAAGFVLENAGFAVEPGTLASMIRVKRNLVGMGMSKIDDVRDFLKDYGTIPQDLTIDDLDIIEQDGEIVAKWGGWFSYQPWKTFIDPDAMGWSAEDDPA